MSLTVSDSLTLQPGPFQQVWQKFQPVNVHQSVEEKQELLNTPVNIHKELEWQKGVHTTPGKVESITEDSSKKTTVDAVRGAGYREPASPPGLESPDLSFTQSAVRIGLLILAGTVGLIAFLQVLPREFKEPAGLPVGGPAALAGKIVKGVK